jgi:hypothetical protein
MGQLWVRKKYMPRTRLSSSWVWVSDAGKISSLYPTRRVGYPVPVIPSSFSGRQTLIQYKSLWVMVVAMLGARIREGGGAQIQRGSGRKEGSDGESQWWSRWRNGWRDAMTEVPQHRWQWRPNLGGGDCREVGVTLVINSKCRRRAKDGGKGQRG